MKKALCIITLGVFMMLSMGDDCGGPPPPPPIGFEVHTVNQLNLWGPVSDAQYINLTLALDHLLPAPPQGTVGYFTGTSDGSGYFDALNGIAPAVWDFHENSGPCGGQWTPGTVGQGQVQALTCVGFAIVFTMTPSTLDVYSPPATLQIFGTGMTTTYGMPQVKIFNSLGNVVGQTTATSVTYGGTELTAPTPNLSAL
jgi:hypothetical protein